MRLIKLHNMVASLGARSRLRLRSPSFLGTVTASPSCKVQSSFSLLHGTIRSAMWAERWIARQRKPERITLREDNAGGVGQKGERPGETCSFADTGDH